jgi:CRISPR-associated protein (TIGR02584 family)
MKDVAIPAAADAGVHAPERFVRRVLLTVAGLTPQIITETVYALAVDRQPPFVPTRVVVLTTTEGANRVRLMLQGRDPGWLGRLCRDYDLPPIDVAEDDVITLRSAQGSPMDDIRTREDNADAANMITDAIRGLTSDADAALHVSMAGGRKTLGFFAGYALSLYGRPQDRLSHVLVSPPFEANQGFFYPTRERRIIFGPPPANEPLDASKAKVMLADIPFVRMREGLPKALREGRAAYKDAVAAIQQRLAPPSLVIDLLQQRVIAGGVPIVFEPATLAFYAWVVRRTLSGDPVQRPGKLDVDDKAYAAEYLREYARLGGDRSMRRTLRNGMEREFFDQHSSKLKRLLEEHLDAAAGFYGLKRSGPRGGSHYAVDLPADAITIVEPV